MLATTLPTSNDVKTINPLFKRFSSFLKENNIKFFTNNKRIIHVTTGILKGMTFVPTNNYCKITKLKHLSFDTVSVSYDLHVNYSVSVLLYKLYKHALISVDQYVTLSKLADRETWN